MCVWGVEMLSLMFTDEEASVTRTDFISDLHLPFVGLFLGVQIPVYRS